MLYLNRYEFTSAARSKKLGTLVRLSIFVTDLPRDHLIFKQWPDWHYGVLSMYASHLAINHLVLHEQLDVQIAADLLDQSVRDFLENGMNLHRRLHLHCWHSNAVFSKFAFKKGHYDHIDPQTLINDTSAGAYVNLTPAQEAQAERFPIILFLLGDANGVGIETDDARWACWTASRDTRDIHQVTNPSCLSATSIRNLISYENRNSCARVKVSGKIHSAHKCRSECWSSWWFRVTFGVARGDGSLRTLEYDACDCIGNSTAFDGTRSDRIHARGNRSRRYKSSRCRSVVHREGGEIPDANESSPAMNEENEFEWNFDRCCTTDCNTWSLTTEPNSDDREIIFECSSLLPSWYIFEENMSSERGVPAEQVYRRRRSADWTKTCAKQCHRCNRSHRMNSFVNDEQWSCRDWSPMSP